MTPKEDPQPEHQDPDNGPDEGRRPNLWHGAQAASESVRHGGRVALDTVQHGYEQIRDDPEPRWLPFAIVSVLLVPTLMTRLRGHFNVNRLLGLSVAGVETFFLIASLIKLVASLEMHKESPIRLLISAGALWLTNILVFALWYWHLDAGGPNQRDLRPGHRRGSFLFPQMALPDDKLAGLGEADWSPGFMDYLFLAFNTSTALSPADTAVLRRWAKLLMMVQAVISLTIIAILAARAINTLPSG